MRFTFTALACVALTATSLAVPLNGLHARDLKIVTDYTTVVVTETADGSVQTPDYDYKQYRHGRKSSPSPTPTPTPTPDTAPVVSSPSETTPTPTPAPVSPSTNTGTVPTDSFAAAILDAHNKKRALHGVPALSWNGTMANFAQAHSDQCVFAHTTNGPYGENLAAGYPTPEDVVNAWYNEGSGYDYNSEPSTLKAGHFTQVVWKAASMLGCGKKSCNTETTPGDMVTCEYDTGNVIGSFKVNVVPPV